MNLRNTYILFAAVVVVLIVFVVVLTYGPRGDADDYLFPELHGKGKGDEVAEVKKSIDKVEIERMQPSGDALLFEREGTAWTLKKPYPARVDSAVIDRLVNSLIDTRLDKKSPVPPGSQAGLDSPSAAITLMRGGKSYRVLLGQIGLGSEGKVYAATGDKPDKPVAFSRSAIQEIFKSGSEGAGTVGEALKTVTDFRPANLLADGSPIPWDVVQRIDLKEGGKQIIIQRDNAGGWSFVKPDDYGPADLEGDPEGPAMQTIAGVKPLLTRLAGLRLPAGEDVIEGVTDFAPYGLEPGKETLRITLGRTSGGSDILLVGKKADEKGDKLFARLEGERFVVKLDAKALDPVRRVIDSPKALRDRNLTEIPLFAVDAIDIKLAGEKAFELRRVGAPPQWRLFEGTDASESASATAVSQLLAALTAKRNVRDFPDSAPGDKAFGLETPVVQIDLWSDGVIPDQKPEEKKEPKPGEKPEEKKPAPAKRPALKGEPTLRLKFGRKDKDIVYVRRQVGIVSNLVALPETTLTTATRPLTDYLDVTLPSFDRTKLVKIAFNRGPEKYEVTKEGGDPSSGVWRILQPSDVSGRAADVQKMDQIVADLTTLQATSVVARKATPDELDRFGLKVPRVEATVTLKDTKEPVVYQFGREADDKLHVYARVGGTERVYLVDKGRVDAMLKGEVADPTIWRIDAAKVRGVKLTGWKALTGGMPLTLDLVRKSPAEWGVKDQADYAVDAGKAEAFAATLNIVRTDRFVKPKGGPAPEHKLDVKDDALVIEVTVDGEKEPYILTLGAETKEGMTEYYFASSNKIPGAVFLVFKDRFADVRKNGRGYFQKPK